MEEKQKRKNARSGTSLLLVQGCGMCLRLDELRGGASEANSAALVLAYLCVSVVRDRKVDLLHSYPRHPSVVMASICQSSGIRASRAG